MRAINEVTTKPARTINLSKLYSTNNELARTDAGITSRTMKIKTVMPTIAVLVMPGIWFAPKNKIESLANPLVHDLQ